MPSNVEQHWDNAVTLARTYRYGDPGEDVSVIADRYFEKLGSIADQGPQARGLQ